MLSVISCHFLSFPFLEAHSLQQKKSPVPFLCVMCMYYTHLLKKIRYPVASVPPGLPLPRLVVETTCPFPLPKGGRSNTNKTTLTVYSTHKVHPKYWYFDVDASLFRLRSITGAINFFLIVSPTDQSSYQKTRLRPSALQCSFCPLTPYCIFSALFQSMCKIEMEKGDGTTLRYT